SLDQPAALTLSSHRYEIAIWRKATLPADYHIFFEGHYYSVSSQFVGLKLDIRISTNTVEVFHKGSRVASHIRSFVAGQTTTTAHMPPAHRAHQDSESVSLRDWAQSIGPATLDLFEQIRQKYNRAPSAHRAFLGIHRLARKYGPERIEAAAA